jgi:predicted RNA-binding protein YlqC (UPF0109 family)
VQAFVEYAVKGLVDHPEAVKVSPVDKGGLTVFELRMEPGDVGKVIGKVIGKQGAMIQVLRSLLQTGAARKGLRCSLEIVED